MGSAVAAKIMEESPLKKKNWALQHQQKVVEETEKNKKTGSTVAAKRSNKEL